jgi:hypothetical protein
LFSDYGSEPYFLGHEGVVEPDLRAGELRGEYRPSEPELTARRGSTGISSRIGEFRNSTYRANSRDFGRPKGIKQFNPRVETVRGDFWLAR